MCTATADGGGYAVDLVGDNAWHRRCMVVGPAAIEKHISSIFAKLGLHAEEGEHRRVLAVLRYLGASR